jgi:YD repeat-containing protein
VSEDMGHRKRVPEDLMGTILGEGSGTSREGRTSSEPRGLRSAEKGPDSRSLVGGSTVSWEGHPERVGITFNLSKQVSTELDKLQHEMESERDIRPSRSEITEVALRIAVEDVRRRGGESELAKRLRERHAAQTTGSTDAGRLTTWRSVDEAGFIVETTYDENGQIVDENVVARVAELPVEVEYIDEKGRLVSLAQDELGNTFELILDEEFNTLGVRLLPR